MSDVLTGWGRFTWGQANWNENTKITTGWGADPYNDAASTWGDVGDEIVVLTAPDAIISNVSVGSSYGDSSWGQEQGWGQFVLNPADVVGLTGVSSTASVGSVTNIISASFELSGQSFTSAVGSLDPADQVMGLTGVSFTSNVGSIEISSNPIVDVTGVSATVSVGSISPADVMGLTGVSFTSAVGTLAPTDQVMGLTGQQITSSVSTLSIEAYADIDTGSNTSYSNISTGSNTSYSDVATGSNTSYSVAA